MSQEKESDLRVWELASSFESKGSLFNTVLMGMLQYSGVPMGPPSSLKSLSVQKTVSAGKQATIDL